METLLNKLICQTSPPTLYGNEIKKTFKKILSCLVDDNISSIGIYGMGGVGKTTIAKRIKFELQQQNYRVYWVTVSQEFSVTSLQDRIARVLGIPLSNRDEEHMRADILRATFEKEEKSVLILDDVWEEFSLENVGIAIGPNKFRLILTTRSSLVCDRMLCERKFKVPLLGKDESWGLFKHTLGCATILREKVEKIAESVANTCAGLPIGIIVTARSMRCITDINEWSILLEQLKSEQSIVLEQLKSCSDGHREMEDKVVMRMSKKMQHIRTTVEQADSPSHKFCPCRLHRRPGQTIHSQCVEKSASAQYSHQSLLSETEPVFLQPQEIEKHSITKK